MKDKNPVMSLDDIFRVETRFMITTFLLMYPKLNLSELADYTGKSKSTLVEHLKKMEKAGIINREEDSTDKGSLKRKFISLNKAEFDRLSQPVSHEQKMAKHGSKKEMILEAVEVNLGFMDINITMLEHWRRYLKHLIKRVEKGEVEEVISEWENIKKSYPRLSVFQPFTQHKAEELKKNMINMINTAEQEDDKQLEEIEQDKDKIKPCFVSANIIPITYVLNQLKEKKN